MLRGQAHLTLLAVLFASFVSICGSASAETEDGQTIEDTASNGNGKHDDAHASKAVLYPLLVLLLGILTRRLLRNFIIPYTGLLLMWGILIGTLDSAAFDWEHIGDSIEFMKDMSPELFLLLFLPVLIFASAYSLDWHVFRKNFGQVLVLAGPGVVLGTIMTATFVRYVLPYDWSWKQALLFGSIMSATDPVAVVAILKEVGASKRLGHVIEGESLFNDGTAFVLFLLFREMLEGESRSAGGMIGYFCQLALGGPAVGVAFGLALVYCLSKIYQDELSEITLTFVTAYLCFYVAEELLQVSGVLSVVVLGLVQSAVGTYVISPKVHKPMHVFWEMMEFIANTIVFVYAGTMIASLIYDSSSQSDRDDKTIVAADWGWAVLLYLALQLIRTLIVLMLSPALVRMGYGMTWRDGVVMVWAGLRGAVSLALALILLLSDGIADQEFKDLTVFFVGVVAALTILVQGTTMSVLLGLLGMKAVSAAKLESLLTWYREMEQIPEKKLAHLKHDDLLGDPDWERTLELSRVDIEPLLPAKEHIRKALESGTEQDPLVQALRAAVQDLEAAQQPGRWQPLRSLWERLSARLRCLRPGRARGVGDALRSSPAGGASSSAYSHLKHSRSMNLLVESKRYSRATLESFQQEARGRLLQAVKAVYAEGFEKGYINLNGVVMLRESADQSLDDLSRPLFDWQVIHQALTLSKSHQLLSAALNRTGLRMLSQKLVFQGLETGMVAVAAFVFAHREAQQGLKELLEEAEAALRELLDGDDAQGSLGMGGPLQPHVEEDSDLSMSGRGADCSLSGRGLDAEVAYLLRLRVQGLEAALQESENECAAAVQQLATTKVAYPEVIRAIKTRASAHTILLHKQRFIGQLSHAGLIEPKEFEELELLLQKRSKALLYTPPKLELPETKDLLHSCPVFSDLTRTTFEQCVWPVARQEVVQMGHVLFRSGDPSTTVYILVRGIASVVWEGTAASEARSNGVGSMVGLTEVVLDKPRARTLRAETALEVVRISRDDFMLMMGRYPSVNLRAWQVVAGSVAHAYGSPLFNNRNHAELQMYFRRSQLQQLATGEVLYLVNGAFAVSGSFQELDGSGAPRRQLHAPCLLSNGHFLVAADRLAVVLHLPTDIGAGISATSRQVRQALLTRRTALVPDLRSATPPVLAAMQMPSGRKLAGSRAPPGRPQLGRFSTPAAPLPAGAPPSPFSKAPGPPGLSRLSLELPFVSGRAAARETTLPIRMAPPPSAAAAAAEPSGATQTPRSVPPPPLQPPACRQQQPSRDTTALLQPTCSWPMGPDSRLDIQPLEASAENGQESGGVAERVPDGQQADQKGKVGGS